MPPDETRAATGEPATRGRRRRIELSGVQIVASVAAAVSAAVAASALGVAGTVVGTALVSVIATVGNAIYTASLKRGKETLRDAQVKVLRRAGATRAAPGDARAAIGSVSAALAAGTGTGTEPTRGTARAEPAGAAGIEPTRTGGTVVGHAPGTGTVAGAARVVSATARIPSQPMRAAVPRPDDERTRPLGRTDATRPLAAPSRPGTDADPTRRFDHAAEPTTPLRHTASGHEATPYDEATRPLAHGGGAGGPLDPNDEATRAAARHDEATRPLDEATRPLGANDAAQPAGSNDATQPLGAGDATRPLSTSDATRPLGAGDTTRPLGTDDATRALGAGEATRPLGAAGGRGGVYGAPRKRPLPRRVAILAGSAALIFVLAFGALTGIEALMGTSFSALWGHGDSGSTAGAVLDGGGHQRRSTPRPTDTGGAGHSPAPTGSGTPTPSGSEAPDRHPSTAPGRTGAPTPTHSTAPSPSQAPTSEAPTTQPANPPASGGADEAG